MTTFSRRVSTVIATWFGLGKSPVAPGTMGSLGALPLYFLVRAGGPWAILALGVVITLVGIWAAGVVVRATGRHDPQQVVVDEVAGTLLALAFAPQGPFGVFAAVLLFRFFDVLKIFPANVAERLPGGVGVVLDDVVAGLQAAVIIGVLRIAEVLS